MGADEDAAALARWPPIDQMTPEQRADFDYYQMKDMKPESAYIAHDRLMTLTEAERRVHKMRRDELKQKHLAKVTAEKNEDARIAEHGTYEERIQRLKEKNKGDKTYFMDEGERQGFQEAYIDFLEEHGFEGNESSYFGVPTRITDENRKAMQETLDAEMEDYYQRRLAEMEGKSYDSVVDPAFIVEAVHWVRSLGAGVFSQVLGRFLLNVNRPRDAIKLKTMAGDAAIIGATHLLAKTVGQTQFPYNDWPVTVLSPAVTALAIYAFRRNPFLAAAGGLSAFFTAKWPIDSATEALAEARTRHFVESLWQGGLEDVEMTGGEARDPELVKESTEARLQQLAHTQIADEYLKYDEFVRMPGMKWRKHVDPSGSVLDRVTFLMTGEKDGAEYWTMNTKTNPNGAPMFFKSHEALDGYAKSRGFVAWEATYYEGTESDSKPFSNIAFIGMNEWNKRWMAAISEDGVFDPEKVLEPAGDDRGMRCAFGLHPALYKRAFHGGNARLDEILQRSSRR